MQNPCEQCVYQTQSWNEDPCYRCGSENNYAWCEDSNGNFVNADSQNQLFANT